MTKTNFETMTKQELRAYVLEHRDDTEAFNALADKLNTEAGTQIRSLDHLAELIKANQQAAE